MAQEPITASSLCWPPGWKRTPYHQRVQSRFGKWNKRPSIDAATRFVLLELERLGATRPIISTDLRLRQDGLPYSQQRQPDDQGAAVWFTLDGEQRVIANDTYNKIGCNLYAIGLTIEAMRGIDRWGCSEIMQRMFTGFKALPEQGTPSNWRTVLEVPFDCTLETAHLAWKAKIKLFHPDNQALGDREKFAAVQQAWVDAQKELKG
ncbi:MAG TPA: hypothetical protein PLB89_05255 [Flavobacteriales bacterium]|nr:hypothetical protein [Flavobacteriales bacterium]